MIPAESNSDLERIKETADGYMDEVHSSDQYGADLVALLTTPSDTVAWPTP